MLFVDREFRLYAEPWNMSLYRRAKAARAPASLASDELEQRRQITFWASDCR